MLCFKVLSLRILTSGESPGEHPIWFYRFMLCFEVLSLRRLTSGGSPGEPHPCWFFALFQDPGSKYTYLWKKSWRASSQVFWALFQDPDSKNIYLERKSCKASLLVLWFYAKITYFWWKSWRAAFLLVLCSLSRSWRAKDLKFQRYIISKICSAVACMK
jgi:hypothetical protein